LKEGCKATTHHWLSVLEPASAATLRCSDPFIARLFAAVAGEPGRISGLLCSFCADADRRSQSQETLDRWALLNRLPAGFPRKLVSHPMMKRLGTLSLWLLGGLLLFVGANLNDPYLIMLRGTGSIGLLLASFVVLGILIWRGVWGRGMTGTLLVLLWCLPPIAMAASKFSFETRKTAVLHAEGAHVQNLGQHFITGYTSFEEVAPLAAKGLIGGIYISHHNIKGRTSEALKSEIEALQQMRRDAGLAPLIVAADQEGGIVSHLSPQLTSLPALSTLVDLPPDRRARMAGEFGRTHGRELADLGVTLNFAPVIDMRRSRGRNPFDFNSLISRRAISDDPAIVAEIASAYVRGLETAGVGATVKHFPGMGRVQTDTHHFRASLDTALPELEASDWIPFRETLARSNAVLMVGHVAVTAIDSKRPASHAKGVIDGLIRKKWGFQGLIVTDDLVMGAIYQHGVCTAVVEALNAGVDLLLVAYDGMQYYRMFDCARSAFARGELDGTMLRASDARLKARPVSSPPSLPGLTRQSILFERVL
jgi:beta-N-acetylhexosaminidase